MMNLATLLTKAWDVLGDNPADPREFTRASLVDAANRGCLMFRVLCHEVWRRADFTVTAGVAEYTIPPEMLSLQRVAWDDCTLEARASNVLQSRDSYWQTNPGQPHSWTSYGLAYNKFRLWPVPNQSSDEPFNFQADTQVVFNGNPVVWDARRGVVVRYQDAAGANYTLTADPAAPGGWSLQRGLTVSLSTVDFTQDYGEVQYVVTAENKQITLWATDRPVTLSTDSQEIPVRQAWQIAILWFVLWQVYDEEGDHHNGILAAWYRDLFWSEVGECREMIGNPVATQSRSLRGAGSQETDGIRYGDVVVGGVPINVIW